MTNARLTPSRVARTVAAALWPQVQSQYRCAPGVYGFSCAGHGGLIALLEWNSEPTAAELSPEAIAAARAEHKTEFVAFVSNGRGFKSYTSATYTVESLRKLAEWPWTHLFEVWTGEEDCDWATLCYASPKILTGAIKAGYLSEGVTREDVRGNLQRWNPDFLALMEGATA